MEQERDYQTVYFKDLLFSVAYHWKAVVILMLVGALIMGGLHFVAVLTSPDSLKPSISGEELTQREQVSQALADTNVRIETQQAYLATSPLMSIDPNQFYQATLTLYIHTDYKIYPNTVYQDPDSMPSILAAYQQILTDGDVINNIAEQTGLPGQYLDELIICTPVTSHPGILNITINAADEETAQLLLDLLTQVMEDSSSNIEDLTAEHTISIQSHTPILCADTNIADMQEAAYQRLTSLQDQKIAWQKQQTSLSFSGAEANLLLLIAIGAVIGIVLAIVIICISHIASSRVYSARTLKNRTGLRILGCAPSSENINFIDRRLRKLEGRSPSQELLSVAAAAIVNYCGDQERLLLVGQCSQPAGEQLLQLLKDSGIQASVCGSPLNDAEAMKALPDCTAAVLIEQCAVSRYGQIEQTMEIIRDHEKRLLGCVLLDG